MLTNILLLLLSLNTFASLDCANVALNQLSDDKISEYTHCFEDVEVTISEVPKAKNKLKFTPVCERSEPVKTELELTFAKSCDQITKDMLFAYNKDFEIWGKIYSIPRAGDFSGMNNLRKLYLINTMIKTLPTGLFDDLENLQVLNISSNSIEELPTNIFSDLLKLDDLNLTSNKIKALPIGSFDTLVNLRYLYLGDNQLKQIPMNIFDNQFKLRELIIAYNYIKVILHPIISNPNNHLKRLGLQGNPLTHLYNSAFKNMTQLSNLSLSNTKLSIIGKNVFTPLESLEALDVSDIETDNTLINEYLNEQTISIDNISISQFTLRKPFPLLNVIMHSSESLTLNKNFITQLQKKGVYIVY